MLGLYQTINNLGDADNTEQEFHFDIKRDDSGY